MSGQGPGLPIGCRREAGIQLQRLSIIVPCCFGLPLFLENMG